MAKKPWMTSDSLVAAVQRKILMPINQATFSADDILAFADEEMVISQVPSIMMYNEEYFVTSKTVPLVANTSRYTIPERAIGMKLRDVSYADTSGNLYEMSRISPDNKNFFQDSTGSFNIGKTFYIEGNDVVLNPNNQTNLAGYLIFYYYLRPNQLVEDSRAAIVESYRMTVTVDNPNIVAGDIFSMGGVSFTAVTSSPGANEFLIDTTSILTATNLKNAINASTLDVSADNSSTAIVTIDFTDIGLVLANVPGNLFPILITENITTTSAGLDISSNISVVFTADIDTDVYSDGALVDFLETAGGHKTLSLDIEIQDIGSNTIDFILLSMPLNLVIGDYICLQYECIIPQIPSDLHTGLAERTSARLLAAMGDQVGLQNVNLKIGEIDQKQAPMIDNRAEGSPLKITGRHSMLRYGQTRRRW